MQEDKVQNKILQKEISLGSDKWEDFEHDHEQDNSSNAINEMDNQKHDLSGLNNQTSYTSSFSFKKHTVVDVDYDSDEDVADDRKESQDGLSSITNGDFTLPIEVLNQSVNKLKNLESALNLVIDNFSKRASNLKSKYLDFFLDLKIYLKYICHNDDYFTVLKNEVISEETMRGIEIYSQCKSELLNIKLHSIESQELLDLGRSKMSHMITSIPVEVQRKYSLGSNILSLTDLLTMARSKYGPNPKEIASEIGMHRTFALFAGSRTVINLNKNKKPDDEVDVFYTHLEHEINGKRYTVAISLNAKSPGISHYIKLFIVFMLKFCPEKFTNCKTTSVEVDNEQVDYLIIPIGYLVQLYLISVQALKGLIQCSNYTLKDFDVPKGTLCHFLANMHRSHKILFTDSTKMMHQKYCLLTEGSEIIGMSTPCLHCCDRESTCSEFIYNPGVKDPVVLATDSLYSDGNNPPVWMINHFEAQSYENTWLRSLVVSKNYSRAYMNINIGNNELVEQINSLVDGLIETDNEQNILTLNLLYPTHHSTSEHGNQEHAHIRMSLFYALNVRNLQDEEESILIPGHVFYTIDSVINYIKDLYLGTKKPNFSAERKLLMKRIKTNLSYLCLPESGFAIFNCYKVYILVFWLQFVNDWSEFLLLLSRSFTQGAIVVPKNVPSVKDSKAFSLYSEKFNQAFTENGVHQYIKELVYKFLTLNVCSEYLNKQTFSQIYNVDGELCDCRLCKSLSLSISGENKHHATDHVYNKILTHVKSTSSEKLQLMSETMYQAESISKILPVRINGINDFEFTPRDNITVYGYVLHKSGKRLLGYYAGDNNKISSQFSLYSRSIINHKVIKKMIADSLEAQEKHDDKKVRSRDSLNNIKFNKNRTNKYSKSNSNNKYDKNRYQRKDYDDNNAKDLQNRDELNEDIKIGGGISLNFKHYGSENEHYNDNYGRSNRNNYNNRGNRGRGNFIRKKETSQKGKKKNDRNYPGNQNPSQIRRRGRGYANRTGSESRDQRNQSYSNRQNYNHGRTDNKFEEFDQVASFFNQVSLNSSAGFKF